MSSPLSPELVWGLFTRSIGLVYLLAFGSLLVQVTTLAGERGITPVALKLGAMKRDFRAPLRYLHFPTLLWIARGDFALRAFAAVGVGVALAVMLGGPWSPLALLAAYCLFLSFDVAVRLSFPWECVLFEVGLFGLFLPPTLVLPDLAATAAPAPAIAWAYRVLLFRVVFGFGKFKFLGSSRRDFGYLKGFLINQPLPTIFAWYGHHLPSWVLRLGLFGLFLVEIPLAATTLVPGVPGLVAGTAIAALMVVIHLCGSFGYFNWIVASLCLPLLDFTTPRALDVASSFSVEHRWASAFVAFHTVGALLYFPWNSYVSQSWPRWSIWRRLRPAVIAAPVAVLRALGPFRWWHSYGVFPPKSMAPVRAVAVVEVSYDGDTWYELGHRVAATRASDRPKFAAPFVARWDQMLIYETYGTTEHSLAYCAANSGHPYCHATFSDAECLMQRILEGRSYEGVIFEKGALPRAGTPKLARMRVFALEPSSPEHLRRTGEWWTRRLAGPHYPARVMNPDFWRRWLPEPELFDFDDVFWRRRSSLGSLMRRAEAGFDLTSLVVDHESGGQLIEREDVERFWNEFLPLVAREGWPSVARTRRALDDRYASSTLRTFERIAGRISAALEGRLEPFVVEAPLRLVLPTHCHLVLFTYHLIREGRAVVDAALRDPGTVHDQVRAFSMEDGLYLPGLLRLERLVWEAHKIRLLDAVLVRSSERFPASERAEVERRVERMAKGMWGISHLTAFLRARFDGSAFCDGTPEAYPEFAELEDGTLVPAGSPAGGSRSARAAAVLTLGLGVGCGPVSGSDPSFWQPTRDLGGADAASLFLEPPEGHSEAHAPGPQCTSPPSPTSPVPTRDAAAPAPPAPAPVPTTPKPAPGPCSLTFSVTTVTGGRYYAPDNVGAVWITDAAGEFVKTLRWWGIIRLRNATAWQTSSGGNTVDAVSGATRKSHGPLAAAWDCLDLNGQPVQSGSYRVEVTFAEGTALPAFGPPVLRASVEFERGGGPVDVAAVDSANFQGMRVTLQ